MKKNTDYKTWWKGLNEEEQTKLCQKHFQGIPVESLMERSIKVMFHYENPSTTEKELSTIALEWWNGLNEVAKWDAAYRHSNITNIFFHQKLEKIDIEILYKAEHTQPPTTNTVTGEVMKTHNLTMLAAMEFGYRECEKGNNLDMAFINFNKALQNK